MWALNCWLMRRVLRGSQRWGTHEVISVRLRQHSRPLPLRHCDTCRSRLSTAAGAGATGAPSRKAPLWRGSRRPHRFPLDVPHQRRRSIRPLPLPAGRSHLRTGATHTVFRAATWDRLCFGCPILRENLLGRFSFSYLPNLNFSSLSLSLSIGV